jgi:hypothetical protein
MATLVELYQKLHELTQPACAACSHIGSPFSCCSAEACCQDAFDAFEIAGIILTPSFLTDKGCVLPPHLRPRCTRYTCAMSWKRERPTWADEYDRIVAEIDAIERR